MGLEPTTLRLRVSRATDCASRAVVAVAALMKETENMQYLTLRNYYLCLSLALHVLLISLLETKCWIYCWKNSMEWGNG